MGTGRWRIEIVEEPERLPVVWQGASVRREVRQATDDPAKTALLSAFQLLSSRGLGPTAWTASFRHNPIAFLLDTSSDAVNLWETGGHLLYRNRAAERLGLGRCDETAWEVLTEGPRHLERRCCRMQWGKAEYLLEIIGEGSACVGMSPREATRWTAHTPERKHHDDNGNRDPSRCGQR